MNRKQIVEAARIFPDLAALIGVPQDPIWHPEGDAFEHTIQVVEAASVICNQQGIFDNDREVVLYAALCHDFGKPYTTTHDPDGRIRSKGHQEAGVEPTRRFLQQVGFSEDFINKVVCLVSEHMTHVTSTVSKRLVRNLINRLETGGVSITLWAAVVDADIAGRGSLPKNREEKVQQVLNFAAEIFAEREVQRNTPQPIVLGRHILASRPGQKPGKWVGELVDSAFQAQIEGRLEQWLIDNQVEV